jgi:hypothetical protein
VDQVEFLRSFKSLSQKGSDPLEAKLNLTLFCCQAGEGLTPFGIGSNRCFCCFFEFNIDRALLGILNFMNVDLVELN